MSRIDTGNSSPTVCPCVHGRRDNSLGGERFRVVEKIGLAERIVALDSVHDTAHQVNWVFYKVFIDASAILSEERKKRRPSGAFFFIPPNPPTLILFLLTSCSFVFTVTYALLRHPTTHYRLLSTEDYRAVVVAHQTARNRSPVRRHKIGSRLRISACRNLAIRLQDSVTRKRVRLPSLLKDIGTWSAAPPLSAGTLTTLSDLHVWLGLKNSDDQGTRFDLRAEVYKNGALVATGETFCITGVTRNPALAQEVVVAFGAFTPVAFDGSTDVLSLKVRTRIGTNGAGSFCGGHSNAVGLRLYFDAVSRPAKFDATL
jgi:hypothetical protein